ncbi:M48 family metallopeptidase [Peteryoungia ipomoeae]|uniref:M48 family metallopeptidase n=1 Tax=Peteryoungia ipomoeae TaxID=1210932 RepID=A0A4S8NZ01_9HYPH|nr:SprT family zinc-dependent metalloprotease [Peteryoungia ipomoeae]THV22141.1 M48 family metallopeptidase [Peteryoungia ipomoeae]
MLPLLRKRKPQQSSALVLERNVPVDGRSIPLTIRRHDRATRITLRIEPGGRALKMTVPMGLRDRDIDDFLDRHQGWLSNRLKRQKHVGLIEDGSDIMLRGVPHRIVHTGEMRGLTRSIDSEIGHVLSVSGLEDHLPRRVADFLKKEARRDLEPLVARYAAQVGKPARSMTLKDTRSRWGSCSWDGKLSFSWRIVMAPPSVIDYLAAHEVAHLREMNHGPAFWSLCKELCPEMDEAKAWLKRNGSALHAIDFA